MQLFRLMYVSTAVEEFTPASLQALVDQAAAKNARLDITGALLYSGGSFLQALEGREANVSAVFERIECDPRHTCVECIQRDRVEERMFPHWSMTLCNFDDRHSINQKHLRIIRQFLDHCGAVGPDEATRSLLGYFTSRVAEVAA